jgi:hypothetical protein
MHPTQPNPDDLKPRAPELKNDEFIQVTLAYAQFVPNQHTEVHQPDNQLLAKYSTPNQTTYIRQLCIALNFKNTLMARA